MDWNDGPSAKSYPVDRAVSDRLGKRHQLHGWQKISDVAPTELAAFLTLVL